MDSQIVVVVVAVAVAVVWLVVWLVGWLVDWLSVFKKKQFHFIFSEVELNMTKSLFFLASCQCWNELSGTESPEPEAIEEETSMEAKTT